MAIKPDWTLGTLTLTAGSTAFTTTGSALKAADIQGGDTLMTQSGAVLVIETITGENSGTLYMACPVLAAGADQPLRVRYQGDASRLPAATRDLVNMLSSGNVAAFAELVGQADMVPIFTGTGMLTLVSTELIGGGGGSWTATVALLSGRDAFNEKPAGFRVLVIDNGTGRSAVYEKTGAGAGDWSAPIYFTGTQGAAGIAGVEYGVTIKSATGLGLAHIGEYPAARSTRSSGRITRFYGEVVGGGGSVVVQATINGRPLAQSWTVEAMAPLRIDNLQVVVAFGDAVSFNIVGITGTPQMAWLQLD